MYTEIADYDFIDSPRSLQVWGTMGGKPFHETLDVDAVLYFLNQEGKYEPTEQSPLSFFNGPSLRGRSFRCQQIGRYLADRAKGVVSNDFDPFGLGDFKIVPMPGTRETSIYRDLPLNTPGTAAYSATMAERYNEHTGYSNQTHEL